MPRAKKEKVYLDAATLGLEEWLAIIFEPKENRKNSIIDYQFVTAAHAEGYLSTLHERTDEEIKSLIRLFLISPGIYASDKRNLEWWRTQGLLLQALDETEYARRLLRNEGWEGLTWILDLLPDFPKKAIDVVDAFISAHIEYLTDGHITGLSDVISIIQRKYLMSMSPREILNEMSPRDFEFFVAALFNKKRYLTQVTKETRDGGADIICTSTVGPIPHTMLVECKHYSGAIGVDVVRQLAGVVSETGASSGLVVTSGRFTPPAIEFARKTGRIQLLDYEALNFELNEHFGPRWGSRLPGIIGESKRKNLVRESASV